MRTVELTQAWRTATEDLHVPPDFADRVVRGGRRRLARRRRAAAGVLAGTTLVTLLVAALGLTGPFADRQTAADPRLTRPTGGNLAGDSALIDNAVRAWHDGIKHSWNSDRGIFDDPVSEPHVFWAGTTPAGPAAVVIQAFYLHPHGNLSSEDWNETQTLVGLTGIDPATGQFLLLGDQYQSDGPVPGYFSFGPGDRTVLVVERETPVYIASGRAHSPEGRITREWQRLTFTDGVAVVQVPPEADLADVRLVEASVPPGPTDRVWDHRPLLLEGASFYLKIVDDLRSGRAIGMRSPATDRRLPWQGGRCRGFGEPGPVINAPALAFHDGLLEWGTLDARTTLLGFWCVAVRLDDGSTILVSEVQEDERPSRLFALTTAADDTPTGVQVGNSIDPSAPLPVAIRLTGGHGWVVAAYGSALAYRTTAAGDWVEAGTDAALLPDAATEVRVTGRGGPVVVAL